MSSTRTIRRAIACLASVALGVKFFHLTVAQTNTLSSEAFWYTTLAVPFVAGALIWSRRLTAQLLARGAWWSMLLGSGLIVIATDWGEQPLGIFVVACSAVALLAAGGTGLEQRQSFAPVAFRGTLLIALVLAMADAGAFTWFGIGNAVFEHSWSVLLMVPAMVAGVIGLMRLRTWGLLVSLTTNVAIATLAYFHVLNLPSPLRQLFIGSAILQMIVPLPMIVSIIRKQPPRPARWSRARAIAPMVIVSAVAALALYAAYIHHGALIHI
jgi:hypothetical protein